MLGQPTGHSPFLMGLFGMCRIMNFDVRPTHTTICSSKEIHLPTTQAPLHAAFNMLSNTLNSEQKGREQIVHDT